MKVISIRDWQKDQVKVPTEQQIDITKSVHDANDIRKDSRESLFWTI